MYLRYSIEFPPLRTHVGACALACPGLSSLVDQALGKLLFPNTTRKICPNKSSSIKIATANENTNPPVTTTTFITVSITPPEFTRNHVGAGALACPAERSSALALHPPNFLTHQLRHFLIPNLHHIPHSHHPEQFLSIPIPHPYAPMR